MKQHPIVRFIPQKGARTAIICVFILAVGVISVSQMAAAKKRPAKKPVLVDTLKVTAIPVIKQNISLTITGYGQVKPARITQISPEVTGKIIEKHTALDQGGMVGKGDILFKLDTADYDIDVDKAMIQLALYQNKVEQLRVSFEMDKERLLFVRKNTRLAHSEYQRLKKLYEVDRVGTLSAVETAEQNYNSLFDTEKKRVKTIALYPLQIAEAESNRSDAKANLKISRMNVGRCTVKAPFSGRVKDSFIETGTYISTGTHAVTLSDDRLFEIQVPLSDKEAFEGLGLKGTARNNQQISNLDSIACRIKTLTGNESATLPGKIHRVVKYDPETRTVFLAVHFSPNHLNPNLLNQGHLKEHDTAVPVLDGMFCRVLFKAEHLMEAVKIPASIFNSNHHIYLARDNHLKSLAVEKIMDDGDYTYVSGTFAPDDHIIITPLSNPIENARLDISHSNKQNPSKALAADTGEIK